MSASHFRIALAAATPANPPPMITMRDVPPVVNFRSRATQLNVHPTFHQVSDEFLVGIAGRYVPFGVVGAVVQGHVACVRVKDGDDLRLGVPNGDVVLDK